MRSSKLQYWWRYTRESQHWSLQTPLGLCQSSAPWQCREQAESLCKQSSAHWSLDCLERTVNQSYCLADRAELLPLTEDSTPCSNGNVCASSSRSRSACFKKSHDVFVHSKIVPVLSQGHPSHRLVTMGLWVAELCVHSAPGRRGARGVPISAPGKVVFLESRRGTTRSSHDSLLMKGTEIYLVFSRRADKINKILDEIKTWKQELPSFWDSW